MEVTVTMAVSEKEIKSENTSETSRSKTSLQKELKNTGRGKKPKGIDANTALLLLQQLSCDLDFAEVVKLPNSEHGNLQRIAIVLSGVFVDEHGNFLLEQ